MITLKIEQRGRNLFHCAMTSNSKTRKFSLNMKKSGEKKSGKKTLNEIQNNYFIENPLAH